MNKKLTQNFPRVVMSVNILLFIIIFWSIFVFSNYFRFFPLSFDLMPKISIEINRFIPILPIHLNNIFYSILIIFAGFGIGKIIFYTLFRKNLFIIKTFEERIFFFVSIGLGFLSLLVLLFGYLGLLKKSLFLMIIILLVIPTLSSLIKNYKYIKMPKTNFFEKIIIGIILYIMLINLFGALTPETFYDSQFYQLGIPAFWIQEGRIFVTKYLLQTFFPFNINMLYLLSILLNNEISAKMIHYFLGVIICFGIYVFSKKYFSKTVGLIAVLIFYSIPTVSMISWKTAIELGIGVFEFGCVFALINFMNSIDYKISNISCADKSLFWLILSAILCGFSLGCKYTSIVFCFLPCLISIFFICISKKVKISLCLKYIFLFIIISFIIASPWFVRNMIVTKGNPFFPFFYEKFGNMKIK
ncbi:MAG: glycosyltransferase family 39 protein, partial [Candidatus Woesearchaeota archaeon]